MIRKLVQWLKGESESLEDISPYVQPGDPIEWQPIVDAIKDHVESHSIYLQIKDNSFVKWSVESDSQDELSVMSVAVAYVVEGVAPWEMEVPAKYMCDKLSNILGHQLIIQLSREITSFAGYYVCIENT